MVNAPMEKEVGKTTVSPEVLHKIARLTALSVQGVSRMASIRGNLDRLLGKEDYQGARVSVKNGQVYADIYVVLMSDLNVREVSREIQSRVSRAISEMIGMEVGGVTVHIMDIDFSV
jgi:uncharacterized alkaline shock family protein YloU